MVYHKIPSRIVPANPELTGKRSVFRIHGRFVVRMYTKCLDVLMIRYSAQAFFKDRLRPNIFCASTAVADAIQGEANSVDSD